MFSRVNPFENFSRVSYEDHLCVINKNLGQSFRWGCHLTKGRGL